MARARGVHRGRGLRADLRRGGRDGEGHRGARSAASTRLGGGIVAVAVAGDLATVEEAVEIGEETARAVSGRSVKSIVFASPCAPVARAGRRPGHWSGS